VTITSDERAELERLRVENAQLQVDADLFRGLRKLVKDVLVRETINPEMYDDRTKWELPFMYCCGPIGGHRSFDEAVELAIYNADMKADQ
jgi:hypothetical protein